MSAGRADAFVFYGATGDLAYKKIFPALQAMIRRGTPRRALALLAQLVAPTGLRGCLSGGVLSVRTEHNGHAHERHSRRRRRDTRVQYPLRKHHPDPDAHGRSAKIEQPNSERREL